MIFNIIFAYFNTSKHDSAPFKVSKTHALHPRAHHLNINTENNVAARAQVAKSALVVATLTARLVEHALALQAAEPDRFADARLRRETYTCNDRYVTAAGQVPSAPSAPASGAAHRRLHAVTRERRCGLSS